MKRSWKRYLQLGIPAICLGLSGSVWAEDAVAPAEAAPEAAPAVTEKIPEGEALTAPAVEALVFDGFEYDQNMLKGRSGTYQKEPSRIFATRTTDFAHSGKRSLKVKYDKKGKGGPYDTGGWCGFWNQFKVGNQYYDATGYKTLTVWIKGEKGGEIFKIGMADMHWDKQQDSVKSQDITAYLPEGKITTEWQKAGIPLEEWFVDFKQLASMAVCFESEAYPDGEQAGTVFIDDIQLEK